jgi:hypothetical protein
MSPGPTRSLAFPPMGIPIAPLCPVQNACNPVHLERMLLLPQRKWMTTSADSAFQASTHKAELRSFASHFTFELRERAEHLKHHPAGRRCCVDRFGQAFESGTDFVQTLQDL